MFASTALVTLRVTELKSSKIEWELLMVKANSMTFGELISLRTSVLKEHDIFALGKKAVAKTFVQKMLNLERETTFQEVEAAFRSSNFSDGTPDEADKFWPFIEKEYLHLEIEPSNKFLEVSMQVSNDLARIASNLKYIKHERNALEDKKIKHGRLSPNERYYRNQLDYFENKNIVARNEIVDFMADGIRPYAIKKSSVPSPLHNPFGFIFGDSPYRFGRAFLWAINDPYDVRSLDEYSNKFTDLPVQAHIDLIEDCKKSPENFRELALAYINGDPDHFHSTKEKIIDFVSRSHLLGRRKQVIETMLKHFERKDYISFVSIAPLQIEGIFADICRELGVSESQLDISSLNAKLEHIDGKMNSFFYYEYYSFKFPVLRNLVAHGGLVDGELENTAIHLMLDLLPVCELTISEDLPINHAMKVLDEANKKKFDKLVDWLSLRDQVEIPDFYNEQAKIDATDAHYSSPEFWEYLESQLTTLTDVSEVKGSIPVKTASLIKNKGLATEQAIKFLKSSGSVAEKAIKKRNETLVKFRKHLNLPNHD